MSKKSIFFTVILIFIFLLFSNFTCGLIDDDDANNDRIVETNDGDLVGTWYRFSRTVNATNMFYYSKMILDANGTGVEYCTYPGEGATPDHLERVFDWETGAGVLTIIERLDEEILFDGYYHKGSEIEYLSLDNESGEVQLYIREMDVQSEALVDSWHLLKIEIEGFPPDTTRRDFELLSDGGMTWQGIEVEKTWFNNGSYLIWVSTENPEFGNEVWHYVIRTSETGPDTLITESNVLGNYGTDDPQWGSLKISMVSIRNE